MSTVRRAFIMSSIEQYLALVINVAVVATMARLLTPDAIGHAVTGIGIAAIALSLREFVTPEFLIQRPQIDERDLRTSFTLLLAITIVVGVAVMALSGTIARFYDSPELILFLLLVVLSGLAEVVSLPIVAAMRRDMAFGALANIRTATLAISAVTTVSLGLMDVGYVSYAWGMLASSVCLAGLAAWASPHPLKSIFRPSLASWRAVVAFGRFKGASQAIDRIYETVPQLILGKIISMSSVGLYNRANTVCGIPDRIIMSAFYAMAFPALAASVREGRNIKQAYFGALSYLSVLYWPGVLLIALTAEPIVNLILGSHWHEAIPLVRILSLAAVFWFAPIVTNPLLLALGHNRDAFLATVMSRCVAAAVICTASTHGVTAMALSQFISLPAQMVIGLYFVRKHLNFTAAEVVDAVLPSAVVTMFTLTGPLAVLALNRGQTDFTLLQFFIILGLAVCGWLFGLLIARHIFLVEVRLIVNAVAIRLSRLRHRFPAFGA